MRGCSVCGKGRRDPRSRAAEYLCRACRAARRLAAAEARASRPSRPATTERVACDRCARVQKRKIIPGQAAYRCRDCRRAAPKTSAAHGTSTRYRHGCRCADCRAASVRQSLAYQRRYREKHGVLPSTAWRRKHGHGPVYWVPEAVRLGVYERDAYVCWLCGEPTDPTAGPNTDYFPSLDHVIPRSQGGTHEPENLRTAHRVCNARRGAKEAPDAA